METLAGSLLVLDVFLVLGGAEGQRVQSALQAALDFSCRFSELPAAFDAATSSKGR